MEHQSSNTEISKGLDPTETIKKMEKIDKISSDVFWSTALAVFGEVGYLGLQRSADQPHVTSPTEAIILLTAMAIMCVAGGISIDNFQKLRDAKLAPRLN